MCVCTTCTCVYVYILYSAATALVYICQLELARWEEGGGRDGGRSGKEEGGGEARDHSTLYSSA